MRDYRDAKTMAKALRRGLEAQGLDLTHSQSLELIAQAFGFDNWNVLAAKIEAVRVKPARQTPEEDPPMRCGFCGKSQHDVKVLIGGPHGFICNECVTLCDGYVEDEEVLAYLRKADADPGHQALFAYLAGRADAQLESYLARAQKIADDETEALQRLSADPSAFPEFLRSKTAPGRARDSASLQQRLRDHLALRCTSIDLVAAELAGRR